MLAIYEWLTESVDSTTKSNGTKVVLDDYITVYSQNSVAIQHDMYAMIVYFTSKVMSDKKYALYISAIVNSVRIEKVNNGYVISYK